MANDSLGVGDREKELAKWNAPYVYRAFPKMLYRGATVSGRITVEQRIVGSEGEELLATGTGWLPHPQRAVDAEDARQQALGTVAAERAWDDRRLSAAAQAEAAVVDQATARHLGEIPAGPKPKRSHRRRPE